MKEELKKIKCFYCPYRSWVFGSLTREELAEVDKNRMEGSYKKGDVVCREGESIRYFIYLKTGLLKLHKTVAPQRQRIISLAQPADFIGMLGIFSGGNHGYSITAVDNSDICFVPVEVIQEIMKHNGLFAFDFVKKISEVSDRVIHSQLVLSSHLLKGRVAHILLMLGNNVYGSDTFLMPINRKEMAEMINMSVENVIRTLSEFRREKIIEIEGKQIRLLNKPLLKQIEMLG